ncbi:hypothetical protein LCGC14_3139080 [marine sediment metagenome]|uniref:Uncharacterized protein n=1 Tax=marine sediment metagenome TaxID=412755 RepID=A0A0F8YLS9_9ZZZZ
MQSIRNASQPPGTAFKKHGTVQENIHNAEHDREDEDHPQRDVRVHEPLQVMNDKRSLEPCPGVLTPSEPELQVRKRAVPPGHLHDHRKDKPPNVHCPQVQALPPPDAADHEEDDPEGVEDQGYLSKDTIEHGAPTSDSNREILQPP